MTWEELGLEEECPDCKGTGKRVVLYDKERMVFCTKCNATGKFPSELGRKLITFLRNNQHNGEGWTP